MLKRAFSAIHSKQVDEGQRRINGIATTPSVDRMGDVVDPMGVKVAASIPLFLFHDSKLIVGRASFGKATKSGIPFEAWLPNVTEAGVLRDQVEHAWHLLKYDLLNAVSIGFNVVDNAYEQIKGAGYRFLKTEVLELSLVPIPAQPDAVIHGIKSMDASVLDGLVREVKTIDDQHLAALGRVVPVVDRNRPGASGQTKQAASGRLISSRSLKGNDMKTMQELSEMLNTKNARLQELMGLRSADHAWTDEEGEEFDGLTDEVKSLKDDIRVAKFNSMNVSGARGVDGGSAGAAAVSRSKSPNIVVRNSDPEDKFKGQAYVRLAISKAVAHVVGNGMRASDIAQARWGKSHPGLVRWIKANEVPGGGTESGEWGSELVSMDGRYTGDFLDFLRNATVFDKLPLRVVPANVTIKGQDGTATGYWVGQSKAIPATAVDFSSVNLTPLKVGALAVISKELIADSSADAEMLVADALRDASAQRIDTTFLSAAAAVAGVSPAGILSGVTATTASGTDAAALRADLMALYSGFITSKNASGLWIITTPSLAKSISLITNPLGQTEFMGLTAEGGRLAGDQVVTGDNVGAGHMILLKPSDIYRIGDSGVDVSSSDVAMIEQSTVPTGATDTPVAASQAFTSMFQEESVAIKVVRRINFAKRRNGVVSWINAGAYTGA